jgi:hypothetical protein
MKQPTPYEVLFPRVHQLYCWCWPRFTLYSALLSLYLWWHDWTRLDWERAMMLGLETEARRFTR